MKYLITESQLKLISELERTWRDFEYEEQYNKIKDKRNKEKKSTAKTQKNKRLLNSEIKFVLFLAFVLCILVKG